VWFSVDHFRPKSNAEDLNGRTSLHHYSWLVYEWDNLYLGCRDCLRFKRNLFPLTGARAPLSTALPDVYKVEKETVVDPCIDRPNEHFVYTWDGRCDALTSRGALSIKVFNLNRRSLIAKRASAFRKMRSMLQNKTTRTRLLIGRDGHRRFAGPLADTAAFSGAAQTGRQQIKDEGAGGASPPATTNWLEISLPPQPSSAHSIGSSCESRP
jgi:hypothetical protein